MHINRLSTIFRNVMSHPIALFILGHAGAGKSFLTDYFVQQQRLGGRPWCVLDKDAVAENWTGPLLQALGQDPNDRDSPYFKQHVRDLQYQSTLRIAQDQLQIGLNVIFPGPWSRELASGALFSAQELGLPATTRLLHVWLELPEAIRRQRIIKRGDPRDQWKLDNWQAYFGALKRPDAVQDGRVPVLDASLDITEQYRILDGLIGP